MVSSTMRAENIQMEPVTSLALKQYGNDENYSLGYNTKHLPSKKHALSLTEGTREGHVKSKRNVEY